MLVGIAGNVMKQNAISPPPTNAEMATEEESGRAGRNFIRWVGGLLVGLCVDRQGKAMEATDQQGDQGVEKRHAGTGKLCVEAAQTVGMYVAGVR
jgi:hypothetical protein